MFTVLSASKLGPPEDTSALIFIPPEAPSWRHRLGPWPLPAAFGDLGAWEEWGLSVCLQSPAHCWLS